MTHHSAKKDKWVRFKNKQPEIGRFTYQKSDINLEDNIDNITYGQYCGHDLSVKELKDYFDSAVWQYAINR